MTTATWVLIVVVGLLLATIPHWRHSRNWGYGPSGIVSVVLLVVIVLVALGQV